MTDDDFDKQKKIQYYSAGLLGWLNTKLEYDKSILTLSAGGIGLLVTLITTKGVGSLTSLVLVISSLVFFLFSLISVLFIFSRNAKHIEDVMIKNVVSDKILSVLDKFSVICLGTAISLSCALGVSTAIDSLKEKEKKMAEDKVEQQVSVSAQRFQNSVNGISKLRPTDTDTTRSFNGIGNLKPDSTHQQTVPQQTQDSGAVKK